MKQLDKTYNPKDFEDRIYKEWEEGGHFIAHVNKDKKPFTIVMPPPNVTGNLHLGHAMNNTLQDILIRWKRMSGYEALWVPGTDHASISTEAKVVEKLRKEGKTKEMLGREGFLKEAWAWTEEYGGNIKNQLRKLGVSCDWSRERFTLDEGLSHAVEEVFIKMYNEGLIYQGDRIVNWCPSCGTAISDAEVEHVDEHGHLWYIKYPFEDSDDYIVIATTRPETMLGDLAVAVHPDDERYTDKVGKNLILPLVNRKIPMIADEYVDMEFGTGCVKITPSHDPNDFEVGERHNLGQCVMLTEDAKIAEGFGPYSGMDRYEAREKILEDLEEQGYLLKVEDLDHAVGHCERCHTVIEPLISKQWFVSMKGLAEDTIKAFKEEGPTLIPERFGKIYLNWLENIRDWCISRQLWWGHRLPVFYCDDCGHVEVSREKPEECEKCHGHHFTQDEDTLDTWFSSALWAFSTLGWPEKTEDLEYFFPTDVLVTGYDIIFFWVIRMVFSSLHNMGEIPFHHVYFTGLIRDSQGRKMSKSLNNGVDPLEVIDQYGADALRFTLVTGTTPGNDMRYYPSRVEANRNFANKLWNATRFVFMNLDGEAPKLEDVQLEAEDRWILSRMNRLLKEVDHNLNKYEIGLAANAIYDFIWFQFCDWYIEFVKPRLYGDDEGRKDAAKATLAYVLNVVVRVLHPFMPFITEEIWSAMPGAEGYVMEAEYPTYNEAFNFEEDEKTFDLLTSAITAIRNQRAEMKLQNNQKNDLLIYSDDPKIREAFKSLAYQFENMASSKNVQILEEDGEFDDVITIVLDHLKVYMPLAGLIDYEKEKTRLEEEKTRIEGEIKRCEGKLKNQNFVEKAPEAVVQKERDKLEKYQHMLVEIEASLNEVLQKL